MFRPDQDRLIIGARQSLLRMAIVAHLDGDDEFLIGVEPEVRNAIVPIYESIDELRTLVRSLGKTELYELIPRLVDEVMTDGWSETAYNLVRQDYKDVPVSPRTFLTNPYYAGKFGEGLYPVNFRDTCWLLNSKNRVFEVVLTGATRWGKDQPLDSMIITADGPCRMGDIKVNDLITGCDGFFYPVTGVYPQGTRPVYAVTLSDGQRVKCGREHLWSVFTKSDKHRGRPLCTKTLQELSTDLHYKDGSNKWFIPITQPVQWPEADLPLDPYLVGALLGDGGLTQGVPTFTTEDMELLGWITDLLPEGVEANYKGQHDYSLSCGMRGGKPNPLMHILRDLDMCHPAHEKRIPVAYLRASLRQRTKLLQGLMDTDGSVERANNKVEFSSCSLGLAEDVRFLVESLGGVCRYLVGPTAARDRHRLRLALPNWLSPFRLSRKSSAYHPRPKYAPSRAIVSVEYCGEELTQCISTSAPGGLYLTDHCVVTHNTTIAVVMMSYRIYLLSLLRDPQDFFGLMHGSSLRYGVFNVFKYKTGEMHQRISSVIDDAPYFKDKFPRMGQPGGKELKLPNHVSVIEGSTELHALGETFIGAILDEVNFMKSAQGRSRSTVKESLGQAQKLYGAIRGRLRNQFVNSPGTSAPYFMSLLSQRRAQTDFLEQHIAQHGHEEGVVVLSRAIWDVQPPGTYSGKKFYVFAGDNHSSPRIIDVGEVEEYISSNIIEAPIEHKADASDIEDFVRNVAGRATVAASGLMRVPETIEGAHDSNMRHPFKAEWVVLSTLTKFQLKDAVAEDIMFKTQANAFEPRIHPRAMRVMHIDLSSTKCSCGMACVHMHTDGKGMPTVYVDFVLRIDPPPRAPGAQLDLDKIIEFIKYLTKNGFVFSMVSFDKYQSRHSMILLQKMNIASDFVSMDESDDPYINLRGYYESGRIKVYQYDTLETELRQLEHDITLQRVFKPFYGSKDVSDALAGAVYGLTPGRKRPNKEKLHKKMPVGGPSQVPAVTVGGK